MQIGDFTTCLVVSDLSVCWPAELGPDKTGNEDGLILPVTERTRHADPIHNISESRKLVILELKLKTLCDKFRMINQYSK